MRIIRKLAKIVMYSFSVVIILALIIILLLRIPAIQTSIAKKAITYLETTIGTPVQISKVKVNFIDNATLEGFYLEDQNSDTLIYVQKLSVDVGFFNLIAGKIDIDKLDLSGVSLNLSQNKDSVFNFQFIIDAFATDTTTAKDTSSSKPIKFNIDRIVLSDIHNTSKLISGTFITSLKSLELDVDKIDLNSLAFNINQLKIDGANTHIILPPSLEPVDTSVLQYPLAGLPIAIKANDISIQNSQFIFQVEGSPKTEYFNAQNMVAEIVELSVKDISLDSINANIAINSAQLVLDKKINVNKLSGMVLLSPTEMQWKNLALTTVGSSINSQASIQYVDFSDLAQLTDAFTINLNHLALDLSLDEMVYLAPQLKDVEFLADYLEEQFTFETQLYGNLSSINISSLKTSLGTNRAEASGKVQNLTDVDRISFTKMSVELFSSVSELEKFIDLSALRTNISRFGDLHLKSSFSGNTSDLDLHLLSLHTDGNLTANLSGQLHQLTNTKLLSYKLSIDTLIASAADLNAIVDSLPEMVDNLGVISYTGKLEGNMTQYKLNGALHSAPGSISANFDINFNDSFTNATYDGSIEFLAFNLGKLLGNDSLGKLDATITLKGSGLSGDQLNTQVAADIKRISYNSYVYHDASLKGHVKNQEFTGEFNIEDENIALDFKGLVNLDDSIPIFEFDAQINKLDLYALNFSKKPLQIKLGINADLKGKDIDQIAGEVSIQGIELYNGDEYYKPDSFIFKTSNLMGQRKLSLRSPIVELEIDGNFDLGNSDEIILAFADNYFPFSRYIAGDQTGDYADNVSRQIKNEKLNLKLRLIEPTKLTDFFDIPLEHLDYATLDFSLNTPDDLFDFQLYVPKIVYNGILIDSFYLTAANRLNELRFEGSIDSISLNSFAYIPQTNLSFVFKDNLGIAQIYLKDDSNQNALGLNLQLSKPAEMFQIEINEPFFLNGKEWQVTTTAPLGISEKQINYPSITLNNEGEQLKLTSKANQFDFDFSRFKLSNFANIVQLDSIDIDGEMNGKLGLELTQSTIMGNLKVEQININKNHLGTLDINLTKEGQTIDTDVKLSENENDINVKAKYQISSQMIDGSLDIQKLYLKPFEPFIRDYIRNTNGYFTGNMAISGTTSKPVLNGTLLLDNMDAEIVYLGSSFAFNNSKIIFGKKDISTDINLTDLNGQAASLTGKINHTYFQDFGFDLNFKANSFKFLDTKQSNNALFYGVFVADVTAKITGDIDLPIVKADVRTAPKTDLVVQLLTDEAALSQENFIIFIDGADTYSEKALDSLALARYKVESYIDLTLNLETNEDAKFSVVIDPLTQDRLEVKGDANLNIIVPASGDITMNGTYVVKSGTYLFSYQALLKRNFEIIPGGNITFNGSPYQARMNIQAKYQTKASVLPLLNQDVNALSQEDRNQFKKAAEIDVILSVKGSLASPDLTFDIQIPKYDGGATQSGIASSLQRIKQNESDLNKQVFSLMLFNSFTGDQSKGNVTGEGTSTAIRSVGNLINRQLNDLIGKSSGFEVNFEVDNYNTGLSSDKQNTVTELDLGVSRKLLNDRISISVGGNVDLESDEISNQNLSNISGDFVVVYHLTKDGKYQIKAFQRNDYDALSESNFWKTGVGFTYKTVFGKVNKKETP